MAVTPHRSRNKILAGGISRYSRSVMYRKRALYKKKKVPVKAEVKKRTYFKLKSITKGEKNGDKRVVLTRKSRRFYPTDDQPRKLRSRKNPKPPKLRSSITPGTILILLAGRHMGKRVVFLKQLKSGLLLVTGPFSLNGTPLRRVAQAYVIATKTKVDISTIKVPNNLSDEFFRRSKPEKKKGDSDIFSDSKKEYSLSDERKTTQKDIDDKLLPLIAGVPSLKQYLRHKFTLSHGQYPHLMVF